jgi:hypothetical protein
MPSRINSTSSYHSAYPASERSGTRSAASGSQRSSRAGGPLSDLASRLSTAGESYRVQTYRADRPAPSGQSYAYEPSAYTAAAHSEYGSIAESTYETATSRKLSDASSDLFSIHSARDFYDIDPNRSRRGSVAESARVSSVAERLSQAGTLSERSFHLSERSDVGRALADGRLGYSTDSSRRLTSYEGSTVAPNSVAGSIASSYRDSLTPSDLSALRAARALGRFVPSDLTRSEPSVDSDYSAYLREGDDVVGPLPASRFNPIPSLAPSDPYSVAAASTSRLIDRTPSFSGQLSNNYRPTVDEDREGGNSFRANNSSSSSGRFSQFGGADIESLSAAGAGPSTSRHGRTTLADLFREPL